MSTFFSPERLARFSTRRPWTVIAAWVAVMVVAGVFAAGIGSALTTEFTVYDDLEADRGQKLIDQRFETNAPPDEYVLIESGEFTVDHPRFRALVDGIMAGIAQHPEDIGGAVNYYEVGDESLVYQEDRQTLMIPVFLIAPEVVDLETAVEPLLEIVHEANATEGFTVVTGGTGSINHTFVETSERDLRMAEMVGLPIALVILVVVFGALVAAGLPVILGIIGIFVAVGITAIFGMQFELSIFVLNMITMIGLAVGIDYSLIITQRFREERRNGLERDAAIVRAGQTASRAVLFSGMAVVVSLAGIMIVPDNIFRSLSLGAIVVVVVAVSAAMTLLPAMLRLLGDRVDIGTIPGRRNTGDNPETSFWSRTAHAVMARPVLSIAITGGLLVAAAVPYFSMESGQSGASTLPKSSDPYLAFQILDEKFNAGLLSPTDIIVTGAPGDAAVTEGIERLRASLEADPVFTGLTVTASDDGLLTRISTAIAGDSQSDAAFAAVERLREEYLPAAFPATETAVTGQTAFTTDYAGMMDRYTPIVFAFVLGLSFLILLVVFRSIVVPIKAIIMNLLSVGAAYGVLVMVFQFGWGADALGFTQVERIESWVPLMMFSILFGLSMDYHVFLLTRIRERFDRTGDNRESVAHGVRATAGLITGAAAIMVAVFTGFAMGDLVMMQQFGLGLAVAITLDATIIRVVLVPASMALLGSANWYLPSWLEWIPRVDVEGTHVPAPNANEVPQPLPTGEPAG